MTHTHTSRMSRRSLLQTAGIAAGLSVLPVRKSSASRVGKEAFFDPWVEVRGDHVKHNLGQVRSRVQGRPILAVIKNDAYGMGIRNMARILEPEPAIVGLAVVKLEEAVTLREAGIGKPILLMGPFDDRDLKEAAAHNVTPMVYTPVGKTLDEASARLGKRIPVHVCVDTGMGRVGVPYREALPLIEDLAARKSVELQGMMMTLTEDVAFEKEQCRRFVALRDELRLKGVSTGLSHAASSYGLFQSSFAFMDMVRPGMALYGCYSDQKFRTAGIMDLRPAIGLKTRVAYVKQLKKGETAGYNQAYRASGAVWIATLPVGHVDGVPRIAASGGRIRVGDRFYPIIASVSSSHTLLEIGAEQAVQVGDIATVFDWRDGSRPEDLAAATGASSYDLIMHLSPLLPRRVSA